MARITVSTKVPQELRDQIDEIAKAERRTPSNVVRMAIEQFVSQYTELHPHFRADILEALEQMKAGDVVPYEYG
jgi:predicted transcriptional regulator